MYKTPKHESKETKHAFAVVNLQERSIFEIQERWESKKNHIIILFRT